MLRQRVAGAALLLACALAVLMFEPPSGKSQAPVGKAPPTPRITRVSPPEAKGAVEVSVAINPTNPDHMIAVSIAQIKQHPGISDFAYVTTDGGRTWKAAALAKPEQTPPGRRRDHLHARRPGHSRLHLL